MRGLIRGSNKSRTFSLKHTLSCSFQLRAHHQPNKLRRNMKKLRKLSAAVILITAVFVMSADAGQTMTPCPPPEPGQTMTPCDPGSPLVPDDLGTSNAPGDIGTP